MKINKLASFGRFYLPAFLSLVSSCAMASIYEIDANYVGDPDSMCERVKDALNAGMILDTRRPLCKRGFTPTALASTLGLESVNLSPVAQQDYAALVRQIIPISAGFHYPPTTTERVLLKKAATHLDSTVKIYSATLDLDNSGNQQRAYILDDTSCPDKDSVNQNNFNVFRVGENGSLDAYWGVSDHTAGYPFIFRQHTFYAMWEQAGEVGKGYAKAILRIYTTIPSNARYRSHVAFESFGLPKCIIYEK